MMSQFTQDPNEDWEKISEMLQEAAGSDTLKELGPMSKEESDYYKNL